MSSFMCRATRCSTRASQRSWSRKARSAGSGAAMIRPGSAPSRRAWIGSARYSGCSVKRGRVWSRSMNLPLPVSDLQVAKAAEIARLRERYRELRSGWRQPPYFDGWFEGPINNATLGALAAYDQLVGTLRVILQGEGGDLPAFYRRAARLARLRAADRAEVLSEITRPTDRPLSVPATADPCSRDALTGSADSAGPRSSAAPSPSARARG